MKKITKIEFDGNDFQIEEQLSAFLYSTFFNFLSEKKIYDDCKTIIIIPNVYLERLRQKIGDCLNNLLIASYVEPLSRDIQKNPSRFEKIIFNDKTYKVNYRMSVSGRLSFAIYYIIKFIEKAMESGLDINLLCE